MNPLAATAGVQLREALVPGDAPAIRRLAASTDFFNESEVSVAVELVQERLAKGGASGYDFVLAEQADELIGYACYGGIPCTRGSYDLYWIVVAPAWQRHGIGHRLLEVVETRIRAAGGRRLYIETSSRAQYAPTRGFYERAGCRAVACLPDFYGPGDDKLIFQKDIDAAP